MSSQNLSTALSPMCAPLHDPTRDGRTTRSEGGVTPCSKRASLTNNGCKLQHNGTYRSMCLYRTLNVKSQQTVRHGCAWMTPPFHQTTGRPSAGKANAERPFATTCANRRRSVPAPLRRVGTDLPRAQRRAGTCTAANGVGLFRRVRHRFARCEHERRQLG